jgi:hypothetical protein
MAEDLRFLTFRPPEPRRGPVIEAAMAAERIVQASREFRCEGGPGYFSTSISEWGPATGCVRGDS